MKVFNKDWIIDLQKSILWQYDKAQKLSDIIIEKGKWYKTNVTDFIVDFFWNIFNLRTANDFGLNIWGKILNFPRQIVLSYGEHAGEVYELSKEQYRFLLIGQILKFQMDATIPEINKYLSVIFPNNNGSCYVIDNQDMTINYSIAEGFLTDEIKVLVDNYEFLPRPAGVKITVGTTGTYILRLEVISEGVPTTQFPTGIQLNITKNGTTVEPIISDNGYELTVSNEDILSWELVYENEVIDSNTDFTISQNTTQYGYITRLVKITSVPSATVGVGIVAGSGDWMAYIQNNVITKKTGGMPITLPDNGLYMISKSSFRWAIPRIGVIDNYSGKAGSINEISEDIDMIVHLLPNNMAVKTTAIYLNSSTTAIEDVLETEIDETGNYHFVLKGEQGGGADGEGTIYYQENNVQINSAGGIIEFDMALNQGDIIKFQKIKGGTDETHISRPNFLFYVGGAGISLYVNNELISVVGGGANGGTLTPDYNSAGGGGYNGGVSGHYGHSGFSYTGLRGNSTIENQNACGSNAFFNGVTRTSGYGGSSYIKNNDSRISNIIEVYGKRANDSNTGDIVAGNRNEGRITISKN